MMKFCLVALCFGVIAITLGPVCAFFGGDENADFRAIVRPVVLKCLDEFGVAEDELIEARQTGKTNSLDPCLLACFFKGNEILDDEGMFSKETALEKFTKHIKDENLIKKLEELGNICSVVNDEEVTDGEKGCERAVLLEKCILENKDAL